MVLAFLLSCMALLSACAGGVGATSEVSGHGLVVGSTALQPLATAAANLFNQQHARARIDVQGGGSIAGLQAVNSGRADIGDSDVYADPAQYPDPNLTDHLVCVIPFAMVVNPDVTVASLARDQIIKIFSSECASARSSVSAPESGSTSVNSALGV